MRLFKFKIRFADICEAVEPVDLTLLKINVFFWKFTRKFRVHI